MDSLLSNTACDVVNGDQLPVESGGVPALCRAIDDAVAGRGVDVQLTVQVSVERRSVLVAEVTLADGRHLPALRMAEMDRPISREMFERFGLAVADHVGVAYADPTIGSSSLRQG
jgi:hypothetical protein